MALCFLAFLVTGDFVHQGTLRRENTKRKKIDKGVFERLLWKSITTAFPQGSQEFRMGSWEEMQFELPSGYN